MLLGTSKSNLTCEAGCGLRFHSRIMLGSCSDRPRIGNDVSPVFKDFVRNFAMQFCVTGAVLGEVPVLLFVVGAVFGEVQVSLFVAGAVLGEVPVLLFVVGAVFGAVQVSWQVQYLVKFKCYFSW